MPKDAARRAEQNCLFRKSIWKKVRKILKIFLRNLSFLSVPGLGDFFLTTPFETRPVQVEEGQVQVFVAAVCA